MLGGLLLAGAKPPGEAGPPPEPETGQFNAVAGGMGIEVLADDPQFSEYEGSSTPYAGDCEWTIFVVPGEVIGAVSLAGVNIPAGSTIVSAVLTISRMNLGGPDGTAVVVAEDADDPAIPSGGHLPSEWSVTSESVSFALLPPGLVNLDVTATLQKVVSRPGFAGERVNLRFRVQGDYSGKLLGIDNFLNLPVLNVSWFPP